jgi:drug/metabolite transporter (DMT)-like permease
MFKFISILLVALVFEAVGVVFLNKGLKQVKGVETISITEVVRMVKQGITQPYILYGVFFEFLFFLGLLYLMSNSDVSFLWPLTSLSFVITTLAAKLFLHEQVNGLRWAGIILIVGGAALVSWSETAKKTNEKPDAQPTVVVSK